MAELSGPPSALPEAPALTGQEPSAARSPAQLAGDSPPATAGDSQLRMAAERTWLAWWRTALVATAGALGVGRATPQFLHVASWPYVMLGIGYGLLAIGMLVAGAYRQRGLLRAADRDQDQPVNFALVSTFTIGGVLLTVATIVLVLAQS